MVRTFTCRAAIVAIVVSAIVVVRQAAAQDYPTRQITMVVAFAAGGFADGVARVLAAKLGERLGQNIVIENRGGGGGNIGAAAVAKAQPDGHTLLVTTTGLAINETITRRRASLSTTSRLWPFRPGLPRRCRCIRPRRPRPWPT
jgi:tripartite-type tricarboxylate transporter receptor subunit TctC